MFHRPPINHPFLCLVTSPQLTTLKMVYKPEANCVLGSSRLFCEGLCVHKDERCLAGVAHLAGASPCAHLFVIIIKAAQEQRQSNYPGSEETPSADPDFRRKIQVTLGSQTCEGGARAAEPLRAAALGQGPLPAAFALGPDALRNTQSRVLGFVSTQHAPVSRKREAPQFLITGMGSTSYTGNQGTLRKPVRPSELCRAQPAQKSAPRITHHSVPSRVP